MTIEHIGIAVKDLESAVKTYEKLLNSPCYKRETVESEQVVTAFFLPNAPFKSAEAGSSDASLDSGASDKTESSSEKPGDESGKSGSPGNPAASDKLSEVPKIELLSAASEDSVIAGYIEKRGEGIHHIAFEVEDIKAEMGRLKREGFNVLSDEPRRGADNKLVVFVHPADNHGVLVELCQSV